MEEGINTTNKPHQCKQWLVMRSTFNRSQKAYDFVVSQGIEAYLPMKVVERVKHKRLTQHTEPLIPNMFFVYSTEDEMKAILHDNSNTSYISFYYNHFEKKEGMKDHPLIVPDYQMKNFKLVTSVKNSHIILVDPEKVRLKKGDKVRVVEGDFRGVVGHVARISGQSRVVVRLDGVCSIATAYIPKAFIEPFPG